ncbi:hypothetical protein GIV19_00415 [Pseudomonas syringae]|uniref:hypothetical protein n=1 Tax=Pseudomonas syringae TaxID=317 RepID=UPI001F2BA6D5|nr:hypothetical protein [Pseudomonas syringae]MCF5705747.1 hypothetical protein [Pseudomonas syringae]
MKAMRSLGSFTEAPDIQANDLKRKDNNENLSAGLMGQTNEPGAGNHDKPRASLDNATSAINFSSSLGNAGAKGYVAHQTLAGAVQTFNAPGQSEVSFASAHDQSDPEDQGIPGVEAYHQFVALAAIGDLLARVSALLKGNRDKNTPLTGVSEQEMTLSPDTLYPGVRDADGGVIKTERDVSEKPTEATGRPEGDTRTAEQILEDNPILKNLGYQKDIKRTEAYARIGDWSENNPDPQSRADAAYNAAKVLNWINSSDQADGQARQCVDDSDLQGITHDGDARHGTEAGNWKDFVEKGYSALKDDHRLDVTHDSHVRADGSNKDNFQTVLGDVGKKIWPLVGLSNVLVAVGESKGGLAGALEAGAGAAVETTLAAAQGATNAIKRGRINPMSVAFEATAGALSESRAAPDIVKTIASVV